MSKSTFSMLENMIVVFYILYSTGNQDITLELLMRLHINHFTMLIDHLIVYCEQNNASVSSQENGLVDSLSLVNSEKAVQELIKQPLVQGADDHLIEFSDAMRSMPMF